jgi:hypothetical protein
VKKLALAAGTILLSSSCYAEEVLICMGYPPAQLCFTPEQAPTQVPAGSVTHLAPPPGGDEYPLPPWRVLPFEEAKPFSLEEAVGK